MLNTYSKILFSNRHLIFDIFKQIHPSHSTDQYSFEAIQLSLLFYQFWGKITLKLCPEFCLEIDTQPLAFARKFTYPSSVQFMILWWHSSAQYSPVQCFLLFWYQLNTVQFSHHSLSIKFWALPDNVPFQNLINLRLYESRCSLQFWAQSAQHFRKNLVQKQTPNLYYLHGNSSTLA